MGLTGFVAACYYPDNIADIRFYRMPGRGGIQQDRRRAAQLKENSWFCFGQFTQGDEKNEEIADCRGDTGCDMHDGFRRRVKQAWSGSERSE